MASSTCCEDKHMLLGWMVVALAFFTDALALGCRSIVAIVMIPWEKEFGWSRTEISTARGILLASQGLVTPLSGHSVDILGPRLAMIGGQVVLGICLCLESLISRKWHLFFLYGVLSGAGYGMLNLNIYAATVVRYMPPSVQGLATGIATAGSTFGQFVIVPVFAVIVENYGWRNGHIAAGVAMFAMILPAFYLLAPKRMPKEVQEAAKVESVDNAEEDSVEYTTTAKDVIVPAMQEGGGAGEAGKKQGIKEEGGKEQGVEEEGGEGVVSNSPRLSVWKQLCRLYTNKIYWLLTVSFFCCGVTTTGFLETHLISLSEHVGRSTHQGAIAFGVVSAFNGLGMIIAGWLTDRISRPFILAFIYFVRALAYVLLYWARSMAEMMAFSAIFGLVDYSVVPPTISLIGTHLGNDVLGLGVGMVLLWHSIGGLVGSSLGGVFFDADASYNNAVLLCVAVCFVAFLSVVFISEPFWRDQTGRTKQKDADSDKETHGDAVDQQVEKQGNEDPGSEPIPFESVEPLLQSS